MQPRSFKQSFTTMAQMTAQKPVYEYPYALTLEACSPKSFGSTLIPRAKTPVSHTFEKQTQIKKLNFVNSINQIANTSNIQQIRTILYMTLKVVLSRKYAQTTLKAPNNALIPATDVRYKSLLINLQPYILKVFETKNP